MRVNYKVSTTAATSNKQDDVERVNFGLDGSNNLVIDVSICCNHIGNSTVNNRHFHAKMHTNNYLQAHAGPKTGSTKRIVLLLIRRLHLQLCQWLAKFVPEFLRLLWFLADTQTRNYYALIGAEEEIGSEAFT